MENMEDMESEDIYYVEITNNKRFNGVYVNKKVMLEKEIVDKEMASIKTEFEARLLEVKQLNIDNEGKKYLIKRDLEIFRLKRDLSELWNVQFGLIDKLELITSEFEQLKRDMLGVEDDDINKNIDEDLLD